MTLHRRETIEIASAIGERRPARTEPFAEVAGAVHDTGDEALADLVADVDNAEVTRDLGELRELEAARGRIADGSYGVCADCGADIPVHSPRAQLGALRSLAR